MFNDWNLIYSYFNPIAFSAFGFNIHWYSLAYITALVIGFFIAKYFITTMPRFQSIDSKTLESYFIWVEIGIILGARFGYLLVYSDYGMYYLTHPWEAFNPYVDGEFRGIAGMSFHGGVFGFLLASFLFFSIKKVNVFVLLDVAALSVPLAYVFGRIGNFLNQELYGRAIDIEWLRFIGIYTENALRYPSQLIEAFLEGIVVFIVVFIAAKKTRAEGMLIVIYALAYSVARFVAEYFREPDSQMGYYIFNLSMGQLLSIAMVGVALALLVVVQKRYRAQQKQQAQKDSQKPIQIVEKVVTKKD